MDFPLRWERFDHHLGVRVNSVEFFNFLFSINFVFENEWFEGHVSSDMAFILSVTTDQKSVNNEGSVLWERCIPTKFDNLFNFCDLLERFVASNQVIADFQIFGPDEFNRTFILLTVNQMSRRNFNTTLIFRSNFGIRIKVFCVSMDEGYELVILKSHASIPSSHILISL